MANPQLEDGYIRIANKIFDVVNSYDFNLSQTRVINCVIRFTYGYNRKEAELANTYISRWAHLSVENVSRTISFLCEKNVLIITRKSQGSIPRKIMLNKDFESWDIDQSVNIDESDNDEQVNEKVDLQVNEKVDEQVNQEITTIKTKEKQTLTHPAECVDEFFSSVWEIYPVKRNKADVKLKQKKILQSIGFERLKNAIERYESEVTNPRYLMYGGKFFNGGYEDYLDNEIESEDIKDDRARSKYDIEEF